MCAGYRTCVGYRPAAADHAAIVSRAAQRIERCVWEVSAERARALAEAAVNAIVSRDRGRTIHAAAWGALLAAGIHENPAEEYADAVMAAWYWHLDPGRRPVRLRRSAPAPMQLPERRPSRQKAGPA